MAKSERDSELQSLCTKPGVVGSGLVRYGAAMYFCQVGNLNQKTLEIYRVLAKDDDTDPLSVAKASGAGDDIEHLIAGKK